MDTEYMFYAVTVNGHDALFCVKLEEALSEVAYYLETNDEDNAGVEKVYGIYELIRRFGAFENYSDEWMEEVLYMAKNMMEEYDKIQAELKTKKSKDDGSDDDKDDSNGNDSNGNDDNDEDGDSNNDGSNSSNSNDSNVSDNEEDDF